MDNYKLDPESVFKSLKVVGNSVLCSQDTVIQLPKRFEDKRLIVFGDFLEIIGSFAIVLENNTFAFWNILTMYRTKPNRISIVKHGKEEYYNLFYSKGDKIIDSLETMVNGDVVYELLNLYYFQGKVPWYIKYDMLDEVFTTAGEYAGVHIDKNLEILELLASKVAKDYSKQEDTLRHHLGKQSDMTNKEARYAGLANVFHGPSSVFNKLTGNYGSDATLSALNMESGEGEVGSVEKIYRS